MIVNATNFSETINSSLPVLIDVYTNWCPPCRRLAPLIEQLASELEGKAIVGKLNSDENILLAEKLGISSLPTLIVYKDGIECERMVGIQTKEKLIKSLLGGE